MFDGLSSPDLQTSMVGGPLLMLAPFGLGISVLGFGPLCTFWLLSCFRCAQCAFNGTMGVARTVMSKILDPTNVVDILYSNSLRCSPCGAWALLQTLSSASAVYQQTWQRSGPKPWARLHSYVPIHTSYRVQCGVYLQTLRLSSCARKKLRCGRNGE